MEEAEDQAANMLTPGAAISGFSTEGESEFGPREEKRATSGEICCPSDVFGRLNFAIGLLWQRNSLSL